MTHWMGQHAWSCMIIHIYLPKLVVFQCIGMPIWQESLPCTGCCCGMSKSASESRRLSSGMSALLAAKKSCLRLWKSSFASWMTWRTICLWQMYLKTVLRHATWSTMMSLFSGYVQDDQWGYQTRRLDLQRSSLQGLTWAFAVGSIAKVAWPKQCDTVVRCPHCQTKTQ